MKNDTPGRGTRNEQLAMRTALIVWLILLIALCLAPVHVKHELKTTGRLHVIGHILAFCITSFLLLWQAKTVPARMALCTAAVILAFATEYWETALYHNSLEWIDVGRDIIGIIVGFVFSTLRNDVLAAEEGPISDPVTGLIDRPG